MENDMIKSEFQIGKNYVKEFNIDILDRNLPQKKDFTFELQIGFSEISINEDYQYTSILLTYDILLKDDDKEYLKIYINAVGEFRAPTKLDKDKFLEYCKFNGAPMISQNIRSYLKAVTALSDIEPINLPMINFKEVFKVNNESIINKS